MRLCYNGRVDCDFVQRRGHRVRGSSDRDYDWFALVAAFDGGSEGVLEQLSEDVFEVGWYMRDCRVWLAVDDEGGPHAVFQFADLRDEGLAVPDDFGGADGRVDDADGGRGTFLLVFVVVVVVVVGLAGEVEGDVLLGDQAGPDAGAEMLVEESGHLGGADVFSAFEKAAGEDRDGV